MKKSYQELLKDPRWQKRRLEVMELHNFECEDCGNDSSTLNIHHGTYLKGKKPWEYPDELLHCLCDKCHQNIEEALKNTKINLGMLSVVDVESIRIILDAKIDFSSKDKLRLATWAFGMLFDLDETFLMMIVEHLVYERDRLERARINKPTGDTF